MRQLVSVVTDERVQYFLQDGDDVTQLAETVNPGLDVRGVLTLGSALGDVLAPATNGVKAAPKPRALPPGPKPKPKKPGNQSWGAGMLPVLDDIRKHPDSTLSEITWRVTGTHDARARQAVSTSIGSLRKRPDLRVIAVDVPGATSTSKDRVTYRIEPVAKED